MTLLQTVVESGEEFEAVLAAVHARLDYLRGRAQALAELNTADAQRGPMAVASLWMEACETAAFVGDMVEGRAALRAAWVSLSAARNPFGESLRVAFLPSLLSEAIFPREAPIADDLDGTPKAWALFNRQQQRLSGGEGPRVAWDRPQAPDGDPRVGRLGWSPSTLLGLPRWGRAEREAFIATVFVRQWDALQRARRNTYLWRDMLAPVALFDLELAVLVRHGLAGRISGELPGTLGEAIAEGPLRAFAVSYLDTVDALIDPGLGEGTRRVLERQR